MNRCFRPLCTRTSHAITVLWPERNRNDCIWPKLTSLLSQADEVIE